MNSALGKPLGTGLGSIFLCVAACAMVASAAVAASAAAPGLMAAPTASESLVIQTDPAGREARIKIPVGAVATFSADMAEALPGEPDVEAMRLHGDVRINVVGTAQPIEIKADSIVLELIANEPLRVAQSEKVRSSQILIAADDTKTFVGNVVFTLPTPVGAMQITADRIEHHGGSVPGA